MMRNLSSAIALLLLIRIAYASAEDEETSSGLLVLPVDCAENEECLRQFCLRLLRFCRGGVECKPEIGEDCLRHGKEKRGALSKNSYLLMKLHPVLNRAIDANLLDLPTRYRRIGVRLGSEFLGKRSVRREEEEEEESMRLTRISGTELLGKRFGSEMLGKRDIEFLGKRGNEFLGKRGNEFLGKRGNEFLGKRGNEFLGKRGTRRGCSNGELSCFNGKFISDSNVFTRYFKVMERNHVEDPEKEFQEMNDDSPNRSESPELNSSGYFSQREEMS